MDQILGIKSVRGATLLGDGALTGPVVSLLSQLSARDQTVAIGAGEVTASCGAGG